MKTGGVYSVAGSQGYGIAKILVVDEGGVHIRLYKKALRERPASIDPASLCLGTIHDSDGFGVGHLPLTLQAFLTWQPVLQFVLPVAEDELEGYYEWRNGHGQYFDDRDRAQALQRVADLIGRARLEDRDA